MSRRRRLVPTWLVAGALVGVFGCGGLVRQPIAAVRPVAASSMESAMRAALSAASSTNWTPVTVSAETGYILAERQGSVVGRDDNEAYRLEVNVPPGGRGEIRARVVPPSGVMGGLDPARLVAAYLDAFQTALGS